MVSARHSLQQRKQVLKRRHRDTQHCLPQARQGDCRQQQDLVHCQRAQGELQDFIATLIELQPQPLAVVSLATQRLLLTNRPWERLLAVGAGRAADNLAADFFVRAIEQRQLMKRLLDGEVVANEVLQLQRSSGEVVCVLAAAQAVTYQGQAAALLLLTPTVVKQDPPQPQQAEAERQKFAALVEHSNDFIAMSALDGTVLYVNEAGRQLVGLDTLAEAQTKTIGEYLPQDGLAHFCAVTLPALQTDGHHASEGQLRHFKTGDHIEVHRSCFAVKHPQTGETICLATIQRDITVQKRAETALRESEERFRAIAEALPEAMVISRLSDGTILYANPQVEPALGLTVTAAVGRKSLDFYANVAERPLLLAQLQREGALQNYEMRLKKADGTLFWAAVSIRLLTFNREAALVSVFHDITSRKQAEDRLRLLERAIAASSNGIVLTDAKQPDDPIIYVNPAFEKMSGYTAAEVMGRNCRFLQGAHREQPAMLELRKALREHRECHVTLQNYRKDGTLIWNELYIAPVFDAQGDLTHFIGIQTNITERKQAEAALREQEAQYRRIVETATEGIWVLDQDSCTSFVNQQTALMLGYSEAQMLGETLFAFMDEEGVAIAQTNLERRRQGIHEAHDFKFRRQDGTDLWAIVSTAPFFNADGQYAGALGMLSDITARKHAEAALLASEQRLEGILRSLEDVVWSVSALNQEVLFLNLAAAKVYGRPVAAFFANPNLWLEVIHPDDQERVRASTQLVWQSGHQALEYRIVRPEGDVRWLSDRCRLTYDTSGQPLRLDGIATDITERKQAEEALRKSEEQFRLMFELAPIGIALNSLDGHFLKVNPALCQALGYSPNELLKQTFAEVSHTDDLATDLSLTRKLLQGEMAHFQLEKRYVAQDGGIVNGILHATLVRDAAGNPLHMLGQVVDITDRKRMEQQLIHDAFHDALTGLHNRALFTDRLQQAISRSQRSSEEQFAVLFLDLDRFKLVNDSLGHLVGDQLLIAIAQRLQACLRTGDTLARLGGDEFAILLEPIHTLSDATAIAERIQHALNLPLNLDGYEIFTTASIGIALSHTGYDLPAHLLRDADTAMYRAKEQGKACYVLFDAAMYNQTVTRLQLETDLRWALERQELRVYYQPIVSLATGQIAGFEALVRWQHAERGLISPAEFIPVAEETGMIVPIGEWVLQTACQQLCQWQRQYPALLLSISVNLSSKQLAQPNLLQRVDQILQQTGLAPARLKLELTESGIMHNAVAAAELLSQLKARHIQLSIDDFGTGYSSLSRLHQFPIDTLKIDRSFVSRINQTGENAAMVEAIIALAHSLGMDVIAEGVETPAQLARLQQLQCEYGQGYLFAKPLHPQAATALLASVST